MSQGSSQSPDEDKGRSWKSYRSRHRMKSHQQAHDSADGKLPPILNDPLVPSNVPEVVCDDDELGELISQLRSAGSFGYDTEFIGEHTYYPRICVIQVATSDKVTLIDTLKPINLDPFWQLLADQSVEKIVHAGVQDLEPVLRHVHQPPRNIFDVQIASAFVGIHYPISLVKLVAELSGADLGHGAKFSQWDRRPLSEVQMHYAANDVRYLPLMRSRIRERLNALHNSAWAEQECAKLADADLYRVDPSSIRVRVRGVNALGAQRRAVLRALVVWREETARRSDLPPRAFISDVALFETARAKIKSTADLESVRGLPRPVKLQHGESLLKLIADARANNAEPIDHDRVTAIRDLDIDRSKVNELWSAVETAAAMRSIHPALVTSKKELTRYLYADQLGYDRHDMRICRGWRAELLSDVLT